MPQSTPTSSPTNSLITLKTQLERSLTTVQTNANHLREQLSHTNALLLNLLLPTIAPQPAQVEAVVEAIAPHPEYAPAQAAPAKPLEIAPAAEAPASTKTKTTTQQKAKAKPTPAPAKSRRSLEVLPVFQGLKKWEAIAQILAQQSGEVLSQDTIIQMLYGNLSTEDIKAERVRIKTALLTGVKDGKWQKASIASSYFIEAPAASAKPKRPGRKPDPSKEPKPEPVAEVEAAAKPKSAGAKAKAKVKASQKAARSKRKRSEVELVKLLKKANIDI